MIVRAQYRPVRSASGPKSRSKGAIASPRPVTSPTTRPSRRGCEERPVHRACALVDHVRRQADEAEPDHDSPPAHRCGHAHDACCSGTPQGWCGDDPHGGRDPAGLTVETCPRPLDPHHRARPRAPPHHPGPQRPKRRPCPLRTAPPVRPASSAGSTAATPDLARAGGRSRGPDPRRRGVALALLAARLGERRVAGSRDCGRRRVRIRRRCGRRVTVGRMLGFLGEDLPTALTAGGPVLVAIGLGSCSTGSFSPAGSPPLP